MPPWDLIYEKASSMSPPLQPDSLLSQSTICCSDKLNSFPFFIAHCDSSAPAAENAQQDPHWPWSFTGLTTPFVRQSTLAAVSSATGSASSFLYW